MQKILSRGHLNVGVSADTLLFGYRDPASGDISGFDPDVARQVAKAIFGTPDAIKFVVMSYGQRIQALEDGTVDMVADVMTINLSLIHI